MEKIQNFDVIYTTTGGRTMVAHEIQARTKAEAMATLKKQMRASTTLKKIVTAIGMGVAFPRGMKKVIAKNIKIEGLSKTTGKILKGYRYAKGGKIVKVKTTAKCEAKK